MALPENSKRLRLKRPDRCALCGLGFQPGDVALWFREERHVTCVQCPEPAAVQPLAVADAEVFAGPRVEAGVPGAGARRQYERLQKKREDRARARLGSLGVVLARLTDEPQSTEAWRRGAQGEAHVAKRLEKHLAGTAVRLLHDRRVPGRGNIDHIAIGPGGITIVDTKNYKGKIRLQRVGGLFSPRRTILEINGRDQTRLVSAVESQVEVVRGVLAPTEYAATDIAGALCFANVDGLPLLGHPELRAVTIDGARRVAKLAKRPGSLNEAAIDRLWNLIGRALPH
jgi:hypothetical protein